MGACQALSCNALSFAFTVFSCQDSAGTTFGAPGLWICLEAVWNHDRTNNTLPCGFPVTLGSSALGVWDDENVVPWYYELPS